MTRPALHLVVSDRRSADALAVVGATDPRTARPRSYDAVEFGGGWYHEAAIAASEAAPSRSADVVRIRRGGPARPAASAGLTLLS